MYTHTYNHILIFLIGVFTMLNLTHLCSCKHEEKVCILAHRDYTCATDMRFNTPSLQSAKVKIFSPHLSLLIHLPPASPSPTETIWTNSCLSVSSPFLELYRCSRNKHSAALPSSQSIMEIFIFCLHCSLHSARKIKSDRSSSLLTPPFSYLLDFFSLPQRHRVCMMIPACYSRGREGSCLSPKCHREWQWQ